MKSGRVPFIENDAQPLLTKALADKRLFFTSRPSEIPTSGPVIVTIGTPVDEFLNPVRNVIQKCIDALLPHLRDGQLLVLRSTLYPGTTDWIDDHIKRQGRNLKVAFCPERIVQGQGIEELARMPQLISGTSPEAEQEAAALFERIAPEVTLLKPIEAEFAKLFTNAYRYIEFAVTNQFYLIAKSAGLDYSAILKAMKHDYPRAQTSRRRALPRARAWSRTPCSSWPSPETSSRSAMPPSWSTRGCRCTSSASCAAITISPR